MVLASCQCLGLPYYMEDSLLPPLLPSHTQGHYARKGGGKKLAMLLHLLTPSYISRYYAKALTRPESDGVAFRVTSACFIHTSSPHQVYVNEFLHFTDHTSWQSALSITITIRLMNPASLFPIIHLPQSASIQDSGSLYALHPHSPVGDEWRWRCLMKVGRQDQQSICFLHKAETKGDFSAWGSQGVKVTLFGWWECMGHNRHELGLLLIFRLRWRPWLPSHDC